MKETGMKILIVDDDTGTLHALKTGLMSLGNNVCLAQNASQALDELESSLHDPEPIDVMVTDLRMPGMNGVRLIELSRKIKPQLPAILMTAYGEPSVQRKIKALKECEYLEKPFTQTKLERLIKKMNENNQKTLRK